MTLPEYLTHRQEESYKGCYGHALLIAGSYGKMGAAVLAARATLRTGVGLLTVHVPRAGVNIMQTSVPEAMLSIDNNEEYFSVIPKDWERYDAIAIGPGIGTNPTTVNSLKSLIGNLYGTSIPIVIDADAINGLAIRPYVTWPPRCIITPHQAEYRRLYGTQAPQEAADNEELTILYKGHQTHIYSPHVDPIVNLTGNAGMATAGSGDVLTGIILSLMAQEKAYREHIETTHPPLSMQQIAAIGAYLHGLAGDKAAQAMPEASMIASDIVEYIPHAIQSHIE